MVAKCFFLKFNVIADRMSLGPGVGVELGKVGLVVRRQTLEKICLKKQTEEDIRPYTRLSFVMRPKISGYLWICVPLASGR